MHITPACYSKHLLLMCTLTVSALGSQPFGIIEHPLPDALSPYGITTGPDGALWFTEYLPEIGRITNAGMISYYALPAGAAASGITTGPDGALWFDNHSTIGRITTSGDVIEFPISGDAFPGIVSGPDNAIWFTELSTNKIGRITMAGLVTEYTVPTPGAEPTDIVLGPDGALWFTEAFVGKIGRIDTQGEITEYTIPKAYQSPSRIAAGPDGALWFTLQNSSIGRITTSGVISEYKYKSGLGGTAGITTGPDRALWFTTQLDIVRMTTTGEFSYYSVPASMSQPLSITVGSNNALWFTEYHSLQEYGRIGEIVFTAASLSITPDSGTPGTPATLTGSGFAPFESINVYGNSTGANLLTTVTADETGTFTAATEIGASPIGVHSLAAVGQESARIGVGHYSVNPLVVITPNKGLPGSTATVKGYGLTPATGVNVSFGGYVDLGFPTVDDTGSFVLNFTVPSQLPPGTYVVQVDYPYGFAGARFTIE